MEQRPPDSFHHNRRSRALAGPGRTLRDRIDPGRWAETSWVYDGTKGQLQE